MGLTAALSPLARRYHRVGSLAVTDQDGPQPRLSQFWVDIYGKEVQSASTYSYTWVADQVGHRCIGIVLSFGLAMLASYLPSHIEDVTLRDGIAGLVFATLIVSYWVYRAYQSSLAGATDIFPLGRKLLRQNAIIVAHDAVTERWSADSHHDTRRAPLSSQAQPEGTIGRGYLTTHQCGSISAAARLESNNGRTHQKRKAIPQ